MLKRRATAPKVPRKRKKAGASYKINSLNVPIDSKTTVEDVRVWDVSTSGRTGRVSASRRIVKHCHQDPSEPGPSTSKGDEEGEEVDVEEAGTLADSETPPEVVKRHKKQRRARAAKENDSVSGPLTPISLSLTLAFTDQDGTVASAPPGLFR
jgi:hypothetical protein